ncbi:MAG TPA: dienelactone hydrolase family protein [Actinomycetales bacterium]|nr:dienelactone hydrolase family protein [Actinomycetales bacterium]
MCVETPGVPALLPPESRGPTDRIDPRELTAIGGTSAAWVGLPPEAGGHEPAIVVLCHERYGVVQHTIELADRFAAAGFVTVAPDFYADMELTGAEERLPDVPDEAVLRHVDAAISFARRQPGCGARTPVAVIGICRSGSYGILASAQRPDVDAVVMLYGGAQAREFRPDGPRSSDYETALRTGTAPVLGLWGERDHTMSVDDVRRVRDVFEEARRSYDFVIYPDMPHGWLNDTMPGRFRSGEANEAFELIASWLRNALRPGDDGGDVRWTFRSVISKDYDFSTNERLD